MSAIIFVDTNILLDFYRVRSGDATLKTLERVDEHHDRIISTYQVEMEFKKNRQKVILDAMQCIKQPDVSGLAIPAFLRDSQPTQSLARAKDVLNKQVKAIKARTEKILRTPSKSDPVYKVLQRLFRANLPHHLTREKEIRYQIRELAQKRWILGYPPRKDGDNSIGDAVNWEWIVQCAGERSDDVVIVSRDSDYGALYDKEAVLNDWLRQEFKQRTSKKRKIILTQRLTEAFKHASIRVTKVEEKLEDELIESHQQAEASRRFLIEKLSSRSYLNWIENGETLRAKFKEMDSWVQKTLNPPPATDDVKELGEVPPPD